MHTLTHNMSTAIYATAKYYKIKEKEERQGCGQYILVLFRKKKSNLEVVLLIACFISTYLRTQ